LTFLNDLIWKHQILSLDYVIFGLVSGRRSSEDSTQAFELLNSLLLGSEFLARVNAWLSVGADSRHWKENHMQSKMQEYFKAYPEYFEFDSYAHEHGYGEASVKLDPPSALHLPVYFGNILLRLFPVLDLVVGQLLFFRQTTLVRDIFEKLRGLYRYHQNPLAFVRDLMLMHYEILSKQEDLKLALLQLLGTVHVAFITTPHVELTRYRRLFPL
jgi:hypothetical protein